MAWQEFTVENWYAFLEIATKASYGPPPAAAYVFRGQSDVSWPLVPTLDRACMARGLPADKAADLERLAMREFIKRAHLYAETRAIAYPPSNDLITWWSMMRHYGAPTRLLDWSFSPFVAAYFAVERDPDRAGAVWFFHGASLLQAMKDRYAKMKEMYERPNQELLGSQYFYDPRAPQELLVCADNRPSERMVAQQGAYTACNRLLADHGVVLGELLSNSDKHTQLGKVVISQNLKPEFLRQLRNMNVTAESLFPGVDGLGRFVDEMVRLWLAYPWAGDK